jgi:6-phosphogluconolactonase
VSRVVHVFADPTALAAGAAEELTRRVLAAVAARSRCRIALAGGNTPLLLYRELTCPAGADIPWDRVEVFWGDERTVPPENPDSNFGAARDALLSSVPIPAGNVHRMCGEAADPRAAAMEYEEELRRCFGLAGGELPRFDVVLLGMGTDGHTASLFPGSATLDEQDQLVTASRVQSLGVWRLTLTLPVLNAAAAVVFLVSGADKAETLARVLDGPYLPRELPAQAVRPESGDLVWLVDAAAATRLRR